MNFNSFVALKLESVSSFSVFVDKNKHHVAFDGTTLSHKTHCHTHAPLPLRQPPVTSFPLRLLLPDAH